MMKTYMISILSVFLLLNLLLSATLTSEPEKVYRYVYTQKSHDWYIEQARLWKRELLSKPNDPAVWANYFMANKYSHWMGDLQTYKYKMDSILTEMGKMIPNSYYSIPLIFSMNCARR
jgi:hypothetical protein